MTNILSLAFLGELKTRSMLGHVQTRFFSASKSRTGWRAVNWSWRWRKSKSSPLYLYSSSDRFSVKTIFCDKIIAPLNPRHMFMGLEV